MAKDRLSGKLAVILQADVADSTALAEHQVGLGDRLRPIGDEPVRGISEPI